MRRSFPTDLMIALLLILVGVSLRMLFVHIPNFAPVAAIALLGGYVLKSRTAAVVVPLAVMVLSDLLIGSHQPMIMLSVYLMLAAPVLLGRPLRRTAQVSSLKKLSSWKALATLTGCAAASSCLFFVVTNLACWRFSGWYEQSFAGLLGCFSAAVPFFRFTLTGDLVFTLGFFTVYAACLSLSRIGSSVATEPAAA